MTTGKLTISVNHTEITEYACIKQEWSNDPLNQSHAKINFTQDLNVEYLNM
jgi:hypothetical protein